MTIEGLLLVNKPAGLTSHDVVQVIRRKIGERRVGHTGTLDPMAQGLLLLLLGQATKRQQEFQTHDKVYEAVLQLGTQTDTGDATGRPVRSAGVPPFGAAQAQAMLALLPGPMVLTPPAYSAVKVHGRPAYWWARRQQPVTLNPRTITIFDAALLGCTPQTITFRVHCSAGTYLRTIAESLARQLGTVGHLSALTRLRVGQWTLEEARPWPWVVEADSRQLAEAVRPLCAC
ncbi:MAG: tRNA pseudouridine(55) synthase TruB [Candidatus Omnitrophica bacterium]|nr:tRNA pseudouridine(55) synthase TruB [Candidatus Omnitrophota bacterium]